MTEIAIRMAAAATLAVVIAVCLTIGGTSGPLVVIGAVTAVLLAVQVRLVRPRLNRRTVYVLTGHQAPRSKAHHAYIGLDVLNAAALVTLSAALLAA